MTLPIEIHNGDIPLGNEIFLLEVKGASLLHLFKCQDEAETMLKSVAEYILTPLCKIAQFKFIDKDIIKWESESFSLVTESRGDSLVKCWSSFRASPYIV